MTAAFLLAVAMVFGGGSRGAGDLVVHVFALPALVLGILRWGQVKANTLQRAFLYVIVAGVALITVQVLPLPQALAEQLSQRIDTLQNLDVAGASSAWMPLTLDRWGTARALLALVNFAAMWLIASALSPVGYCKLLQMAACVAVVLVFLGFAQISGIGDDSLAFHKFQNTEVASAVFANRNHFATLLAMLAPVALLFGYQAQRRRDSLKMWLWYFALALLLLGAAMTFSRTGILLATLSTGIVGAMALLTGIRSASRGGALVRSHSGLALALAGAGLAVANYAWGQIIDRFQQDPLGDRRWEYLKYGWAAASDYVPWGAGFGSFRDVYASFEPVTSTVKTYALHAHNDILELLLEAGVPGIIVLLAGLGVLGAGVRRRIAQRNSQLFEKALAVSAIVPLIHSLVDYPLRTLAVTTLFALIVAGVLRPWPPVGASTPAERVD